MRPACAIAGSPARASAARSAARWACPRSAASGCGSTGSLGTPGSFNRSAPLQWRSDERHWSGALRRLIRLEQPVDVVELFLGAGHVAGTAAQLVEDLAALLALELKRHLVDAGI